MARRLAAITGASSGIGAAFARRLAQRGYDLILIARRLDRLHDLADALARDHGSSAEALGADLSTDNGISSVVARLAAEPKLAMLVNNAGFGTKGRFFEAPVDEQERMHRVHMDATMRLTHAVLPGMVQRNDGAIINVSSVAAFTRSPANVSYCATKAWMNAFTEGLFLELAGMRSCVTVQALCPGFTYSEFHDVIGASRDPIPKWLWMKADDVVDASLAGLRRRKLFVIPGWQYRLFVALATKLPARMRLVMEARSPHTRTRMERAESA
jgi:short-subunit dehydrogenase